MDFPDPSTLLDAAQARLDPWWPFLWSAAVSIVVGGVLYLVAVWAIRRTLGRKPGPRAFLERARAPVRLIVPLVIVLSTAGTMPADSAFAGSIRHWLLILLILLIGWLGLRLADGFQRAVEVRWPVDVADNLQARAIRTQSLVLMRTIKTVVILLALGAVLTTFPSIRQLGASLLASAGLAGLVVGFAARPVLGNLIAGLQLALTQPIRIDDVLIVEGEWGRVEEIRGTYVVIRIWDDRRLIVPLQWFIENPFQNWTRRTAQLLGTVTLWVDFRLPLEPLREELERLCRSDPDWDGRLAILQVVEAGPQSMQLRALVSAASSGQAWDLRCRVREGLVAFIARTRPECLPRLRAELDEGEAPAPVEVDGPASDPAGSGLPAEPRQRGRR
jgi:small-conductance mechanosensitive channel